MILHNGQEEEEEELSRERADIEELFSLSLSPRWLKSGRLFGTRERERERDSLKTHTVGGTSSHCGIGRVHNRRKEREHDAKERIGIEETRKKEKRGKKERKKERFLFWN